MNLKKQAVEKHYCLPGKPLHIKKINSRQTGNAFIRMPWPVYKDDPMWVPPLLLERRMHLSPKNPYFDHARCGFWIAYRHGKPVGRISAQIDQLHLQRYQDRTGFWGMLEAEDNVDTFQALMNTAETWLQRQGMTRARGPFNLSINQECGLLVAGFDTPPSIMMGHARPYYQKHIEQCGYQKTKDLFSYTIDWGFTHSAAMRLIMKRTRNRVHTRPFRKAHFQEDLNIVQDIFNDAWSGNWGFVPFTQKEFDHLGKDLKLLVNDKLIRIAEVNGEPAAFMLVLPNLNEVIRDLNGRLFPFGWLKLLWRLKVKYPETARIPLMGVRSQYHDSLLGAALAYRLIGDIQEAGEGCGIKKLELSWILEDNTTMRNIITNIGGTVYKTYRIYDKPLSS
ncbi:MAG: N-acetyltransferase [Desulfobacterales bacterium]|nr:N-acetyltransferase [Desulfobacterales bacterium]